MEKNERYNWMAPGNRGRLVNIPLEDLEVDRSYQRDEVSNNNTLNIASNFSWNAFGCLIVCRRPDGKKMIVDGQQRFLAAKRRGDIREVPCIVFDSMTLAEEAKTYFMVGTRRHHLTAANRFKAAALAGIQPEKDVSDWLSSVGMTVYPGQNHCKSNPHSGMSFIRSFVRSWTVDSAAAKAAIQIQKQILAGNEYLCNELHDGIFYLLRDGVDVAAHVDKIVSMGGKLAVLREIKRIAIEGNIPVSNRVCWRGLLNVINFKRRNKIGARSAA